jgi:hypothetical protein
MKLGMLAAYIDYTTTPPDVSLQSTGKTPAVTVIIGGYAPPIIGDYAQQVAQAYADQDGLMLRDFVERLIFRYQWEHRDLAAME